MVWWCWTHSQTGNMAAEETNHHIDYCFWREREKKYLLLWILLKNLQVGGWLVICLPTLKVQQEMDNVYFIFLNAAFKVFTPHSNKTPLDLKKWLTSSLLVWMNEKAAPNREIQNVDAFKSKVYSVGAHHMEMNAWGKSVYLLSASVETLIVNTTRLVAQQAC